MNKLNDEVSHIIENQLHVGSEGAKAPPLFTPAALITMIFGTSIGLSMQYLICSDAKDVVNGFGLLSQTLERMLEKGGQA